MSGDPCSSYLLCNITIAESDLVLPWHRSLSGYGHWRNRQIRLVYAALQKETRLSDDLKASLFFRRRLVYLTTSKLRQLPKETRLSDDLKASITTEGPVYLTAFTIYRRTCISDSLRQLCYSFPNPHLHLDSLIIRYSFCPQQGHPWISATTEAQIKQFKQHIMVMVATDMSWLIYLQS